MITGTLSPVSNKATWKETFKLTDSEDGDAIDISGAEEITISIRDPKSRCILLTGSLSDGDITIVDDGTFQLLFDDDTMGALSAKTYDIGCTIKIDGETTQLLVGKLPVVDGVV